VDRSTNARARREVYIGPWLPELALAHRFDNQRVERTAVAASQSGPRGKKARVGADPVGPQVGGLPGADQWVGGT
jgi:hypothetical protein